MINLKYLTEVVSSLEDTQGSLNLPDPLLLDQLGKAEVHGVEAKVGGAFNGDNFSSVPMVVTGFHQYQGAHSRTEVRLEVRTLGLLGDLSMERGKAFFVRAFHEENFPWTFHVKDLHSLSFPNDETRSPGVVVDVDLLSDCGLQHF